MPELDQHQIDQLTGGGDCSIHSHEHDRTPTQEFLHGLQGIYNQRTVTSDYVVTTADDLIIADTSNGANVTITLPKAINGNEVEIMKPSGLGTLIVIPSGSDTVLNTTGVSVSVANAALHFKSFGTDWKLI